MSAENYRSASKSKTRREIRHQLEFANTRHQPDFLFSALSITFCLAHDPGWNDPPKVAYGSAVLAGANDGGHTAPSQPKPLLNKRVAFPLQSGSPATALPSLAGPPMVAGPPPSGGPPVTTGFRRQPTSESSADQQEPASAGESREDQFRQIQSALNGCVERLDVARRPEVQKRLNLIYEAWSGEKLGTGLEQYLHQFATGKDSPVPVAEREEGRKASYSTPFDPFCSPEGAGCDQSR